MVLRDHLEKLHYFYQVAKAGSFKEASQKINITQPSLTKSIQILEGSIDRKLFLRQPRGVQLTTEGEVLFDYCHQLFADLNEMEIKLQAPEDPMAGSLRVGTYDSIAIYFWPKFLRNFLPKFPNLSLELTTGRSSEIQACVEKGELDLGLIIEPHKSQNTETVYLSEDRFQLYETVCMDPIYESVETAPLIFMPDALAGQDNTRLLMTHPKLESHNPRMVYKTSSLESAKELLLNGIGIALLPEFVAKSDVEAGNIRRVVVPNFPEQGVGKHRLGLVFPKHKANSPTLKGLIEELQKDSF